MSDPITKIIKKNTYERSIPKDGADFLCKKIEKLKVEMKEKEKKDKAETKKEGQTSRAKSAGKTTGGKERGETSVEALINEQTAVTRQLIASVNSLTNAVQVLTSTMEKD